MSTFWITVEEAFATKPKEGGGGYTDFTARDANGAICFCNVGWKNPNNQPKPGLAMEFEPYNGALSYDPSNYQGGRRVSKENSQTPRPRDMSPAGNPHNGPQNAQGAPQSRANTQGAAGVAAPPVPTVTEYGQGWAGIFPRSHALMTRLAPEGVSADTIFMAAKDFTTSVMIGLQRRDIRRDPSQAEVEAEAAAKQAAAEAAAEEAQRLAAEAAERAKAAAKIPLSQQGYVPSGGAGDADIPF